MEDRYVCGHDVGDDDGGMNLLLFFSLYGLVFFQCSFVALL